MVSARSRLYSYLHQTLLRLFFTVDATLLYVGIFLTSSGTIDVKVYQRLHVVATATSACKETRLIRCSMTKGASTSDVLRYDAPQARPLTSCCRLHADVAAGTHRASVRADTRLPGGRTQPSAEQPSSCHQERHAELDELRLAPGGGEGRGSVSLFLFTAADEIRSCHHAIRA